MANFGDARDEIAERARRAKMKIEVTEATIEREATLSIEFPNGPTVYAMAINRSRANTLLEYNFEQWVILGDYLVIYDETRKLIEANIVHLVGSVRFGKSLMDLPGVSWGSRREPGLFDDLERTEDFDDALAEPASKEALLKDRPWKLPLRGADETPVAEFSSCSPGLLALDASARIDNHWRTLGITITTQEHQSHDEASKLMEQTCSALFFEMDLRYGMQLGIAQRRLIARQSRPHYPKEAEAPIWKAPQVPAHSL